MAGGVDTEEENVQDDSADNDTDYWRLRRKLRVT